ncbi:hypothetical protein QOZ80_4AG0305540 [Eleusine coracana subsp. coracana]|nr:hypothetical protein QOZ80_4AG0305540 [Eleusine coracana subsp. coracana]
MLSIKEVLRSSVPCPHCGTAISRVSGCNHMICRRCGKAFCYGCGDLGCSGCGKNRSTDPTQLDVISFLGEETQKETHKQPTLQESSRQHPCPNCHQPNPKMGNNNHIFCSACQVHYCASCRKVVRKYTEHYGPRGCKQHTIDPERFLKHEPRRG